MYLKVHIYMFLYVTRSRIKFLFMGLWFFPMCVCVPGRRGRQDAGGRGGLEYKSCSQKVQEPKLGGWCVFLVAQNLHLSRGSVPGL